MKPGWIREEDTEHMAAALGSIDASNLSLDKLACSGSKWVVQ